VWGPAGMPADLVSKINADVRKALADPGVKEKLANTGNVPFEMTAPQFAKFVRSEMHEYQRIVKAAGIKPQ
jgi:tripartite-type tricarboxylate transporter receptor subunit TctC